MERPAMTETINSNSWDIIRFLGHQKECIYSRSFVIYESANSFDWECGVFVHNNEFMIWIDN